MRHSDFNWSDVMAHCGLVSSTGRAVPLRAVAIEGEVMGGQASLRVRQTYLNIEDVPIEAVYTFPLPSEATLTGFSMTCRGRRLRGEVREREQAFREYDEAIAGGHGGALLDQERRNVFTAQVGNLLPGEETVIEVETVERLLVDEGTLRLLIPTVVAPRYVPGQPYGDRTAHGRVPPTDRVTDADRISPPVGDASYRFTLDLTVNLGHAVSVESPSHPLSVERGQGGRVRLRLRREDVTLDRDVVINVRGLRQDEPLTAVACHRTGPDDGAVAVTVVPDLYDGGASSPQSVVFVVDVSGSMHGRSIDEARAALRLCLRHLRAGDLFNIVAFSSSFHMFQGQLAPFDQAGLEAADRWVARLQAGGGTELLEPLVQAVRMAGAGVVMLLTDGQVANEAEVLREVLSARDGARIYSFGIGTAVSDVLLQDLAQRTGGKVELIHPGERIDEKVVAQFARAVAPRVRGLRASFEGVEVSEQAPAPVPELIDGEAWALYARYAAPGEGRLRLTGTLRGEPWELVVPLLLPEIVDRPMVGRCWAAQRVRDLEVADLSGRRAKANEDRIVRIAVQYGIASSATSFVVIEEREGDRRMSVQPATRVVPVSAPAGWGTHGAANGAASLARHGSRGAHLAALAMPMAAPARPAGRPSITAGLAGSVQSAGPSAPPQGSGGIIGRVGELLSGVFSGGAARSEASMPAFEGVAEPGADIYGSGGSPVARRSAVVELLEVQQASGLWLEPGPEPEPVRALLATARALLRLFDLCVGTSDPLHGGQVRKAVDATLTLVAKERPTGATLELALGSAWLVANGRRTRAAVERAIAAEPSLAGLRAVLGHETAVRDHLDLLEG